MSFFSRLFRNKNTQQQAIEFTASADIFVFLAKKESYREFPYFATEYERQRGMRTIGFGHLIKQGESFSKLSVPDAMELMLEDIKDVEAEAKKFDLQTQGQFDALVSLLYNIGTGSTWQNSNSRRRLLSGDYDGFADGAFHSEHGFVRQGGTILRGLVKRRQAEKEMFLA